MPSLCGRRRAPSSPPARRGHRLSAGRRRRAPSPVGSARRPARRRSPAPMRLPTTRDRPRPAGGRAVAPPRRSGSCRRTGGCRLRRHQRRRVGEHHRNQLVLGEPLDEPSQYAGRVRVGDGQHADPHVRAASCADPGRPRTPDGRSRGRHRPPSSPWRGRATVGRRHRPSCRTRRGRNRWVGRTSRRFECRRPPRPGCCERRRPPATPTPRTLATCEKRCRALRRATRSSITPPLLRGRDITTRAGSEWRANRVEPPTPREEVDVLRSTCSGCHDHRVRGDFVPEQCSSGL